MADHATKSSSLPASFWLAAAFVWLVMFSLASLSPFMTDNYLFRKNMTPGYAEFMAGAPIESLEPMTITAAFDQSVRMYTTWCGRFMGNFFVYTSFLLPDMLRVALSALLFVGVCVLIHVHIYGSAWKEKLKASSLLFIAAFLWVGMPSFGSAFFWVSVGGMPAIVFQLLFLLPYRMALDPKGLDLSCSWPVYGLFCLLMILLGLCTASLDYASSAAMPVAALAGCILCVLRKARKSVLALLFVGFVAVSVGAAITLLAPGNAGRIAHTTDLEVHAWLEQPLIGRIADYCVHLPQALAQQWLALFLLVWAFWVLWRCYKGTFVRHIPLLTCFYLVPFAATHGAYFFTPWPPERAFATTYVQLVIASFIAVATAIEAGNVFVKARQARRVLRIFLCCVGAVAVVMLVQDAYKFYFVHAITEQRDALYAEHRGQDVRVPALTVQGDSRMVLGYHLNDLDRNPDFWLNRAVAKYWDLKSVAIEDEAQRTFQLDMRDAQGNVCTGRLWTDKGSLFVDLHVASQKQPPYNKLYIYYYGKPAALYLLLQPLNDSIARHMDADFFLPQLVPLLFAQSSAPLTWTQIAPSEFRATGSAKLWGQCAGAFPFWLVPPGKNALNLTFHYLSDESSQSH